MIFYFSATGNTRWAATTLAKALGEEAIDMAAALYPKRGEQLLRYALSRAETVGLCFPVHGWRPAPLARHFLCQVQLAEADGRPARIGAGGHYCWALCTAGDDIGESMERLETLIAQRGWQTDSRFSLIMPESYVGLPFMNVDKPDKEEEKRRTAALTLAQHIAPVLNARRHDVTMTYKGHWPRLNSRLLGAVFERHIVGDRPFRVDSKRCTACGRCAAVCPVGDIDGGPGRQPQWLHTDRCMSCFACYHHCPARAIDYGSRTKGKGQYHYESITDKAT
ncbi:MAG: EFR1 family ferrodoxin [Prevotella sp.]|nr:EFR1 family ferrodoxin [Prevotella sp.]